MRKTWSAVVREGNDQSHQRHGFVVFAHGFKDSRCRLFFRCSSMYWKQFEINLWPLMMVNFSYFLSPDKDKERLWDVLDLCYWNSPAVKCYHEFIKYILLVKTRPKSPYGRQGLAGSWGKDTVRRVHFGDPTDLLWCKNVTSPTEGFKWPPLVQKRYVTNTGPQLTFFGAKTLRR